MLIAIIPIHSIDSAKMLMEQASQADVFEFRLDYLSHINLQDIKKLQAETDKKILFTLRKVAQGGVFNGDESQRLQLIAELISLQPDYLDIEHDVPLAFCEKLKIISPQTKLICSYHNFIDTPDDLPTILEKMQNPIFSVYKIITTAHSILDTLRVMHFVKYYSDQYPLIAHAMGEVGESSRILGKIFGNYFSYVSVDDNNIAPGLVSLEDFINIYHYPTLNRNTQIYGLIGDPVSQSIGHIFHNNAFIENHQNAVYVKFHVKPEELSAFFAGISDFPIEGLSVTMPHKQAVISFCYELTEDVQKIGAANTLVKTDKGYLAANTDGEAVVQILPKPLNHKKIVILGAGGAASSIIYSLQKNNAQIEVYNRTVSRPSLRAQRGNPGLHLENSTWIASSSARNDGDLLPLEYAINADYDILINTIPAKYYNVDLIRFIPDKIIMDANYQQTTTQLIQDAIKQGCQYIEGQDMFYAQAKLQRKLWFNENE